MEELTLNQLISKYDFVVNTMKALPESKRTEESFVKLLQKYATFKSKKVEKSSVRLIIDGIEYVVNNKVENQIQDFIDNIDVNPEEQKELIDWEISLSDSVVKTIIVKHFLNEI